MGDTRLIHCPVCGRKMSVFFLRCPAPSCNTPIDDNEVLKQSAPPLNGAWIGREDAKRIIEGAAVVVRRPLKTPQYDKHFSYDVRSWFRPDQIDQNTFGDGNETYLVLENTIT